MAALALPHFHTGKARDTYLVPGYPDLLAVYASNRISTHNIVHETLIPLKGEVLTAQTVYFAKHVLKGIPTHLVASGEAIFRYVDKAALPEGVEKQLIIVKKATPILREFVWRRYLTGSLYRALQKGPDPYGLRLDRTLPLMFRFIPPIFTPTMKSENDEPVHAHSVEVEYPEAVHLTCRALDAATVYLLKRNVVLIDTKLETDGQMIIDEFFTGDSSRFARVETVMQGVEPPYLDKEPVRKIAESRWGDGKRYALSFSDTEVAMGMKGYLEAFEMIGDKSLAAFQMTDLAHEFV